MKKFYLVLTSCIILYSWSVAQSTQGKTVKPVYGNAGIRKTIAELKANKPVNMVRPLNKPLAYPLKSHLSMYKNIIRPGKASREVPALRQKINSARHDFDPPQASTNTVGTTQQVWSNFLSTDFYENTFGWPPDPSGAVSNNQVIVATWNEIKIHNKSNITDPPLTTPTGYSRVMADGIAIALTDFFSAITPPGSYPAYQRVCYDRLSKRWFIAAAEVNFALENNAIFLAVSDTGKITDISGFTFYSFNSSLFPYDPNAPYAPFLFSTQLGVDKNSVLIGGNQDGYDSLTNAGYVIDKNKLLQGNLVIYPFQLGVFNFIDGSVGGMWSPLGVNNDDGTTNKSFFAGITYFNDGLVVAKLGYNKKRVPEFTSQNYIAVPPFNYPRDNSSPGGLTPLNQNDGRLLEAVIHKNKESGVNSLWTSHAIGVDKDGLYIGSESEFLDKGRTASRWYQLNSMYTDPYLNQYGTLVDSDQPSGRRAKQYFNPSIAMSGQGHSLLGGTTDAFNEYLDVFIAGRYYGETKGTLHSPQKATNTTAIYAPYLDFSGGREYLGNWGNYSQTVIDPVDDQTIWTFQEYANIDDSYGVRAVQLKAPPPATPFSLGDLSDGEDTTIILNGVSIDNSGFFDPGEDMSGPGFNRLSVTSTGNITVSDIIFLKPTSISLKLHIKNKPAGNYFLVISNPDGQAIATNYSIIPKIAARSSVNKPNPEILRKEIAKKYVVTSGIYPNPGNGDVKLKMNAVKSFAGKVMLMTTAGKMIAENTYNFAIGNSDALLSLADLGSGTYIAAVYNQDKILLAVHTIVKQ